MKRWIAIGGIALGVGLVGYALLSRDTDEELIRARLDQLTTAVRVDQGDNPLTRGARVRRAFNEVLSRNIVVRIPDLPDPGQGREGLLGVAMYAGHRYRTAEVALSDTSIQLDTRKIEASVKSEATLTATDAAGLHRQNRHVLFRFTRAADHWRISSIEVSAPPDLPPEARP
jgi:hypothetical protein